MPYILSPLITEESEGMWSEGQAYKKEGIYKIEEGKLPPVNYDKHIINSHSLTHAEAPMHTQENGKTIDSFFNGNFFHGKCRVVRLKGDNYKKVNTNTFHWEVSLSELQLALDNKQPDKILLTIDNYKKNKDGYHDPNIVLTLTQEAADWLIENKSFSLYGTSWKSSDFKPGGVDRPIHNTLFKQAVILECLDLEKVPEGEYFLVAYPLRIKGASESPVTPVLFTYDEINQSF
jgi:arylformamidase